MSDSSFIPQLSEAHLTESMGSSLTDKQQAATSFGNYMKEEGLEGQQNANAVSQASLPSPQMEASLPTLNSLHSQMGTTSVGLGNLFQQLSNPNLKLRADQMRNLSKNIEGLHENIQSAAAQLGVPKGNPSTLSEENPFVRFLSLVAEGQSQLQGATQAIQHLSEGGKTLNPAQFLLVQVKLNRAQQQIEFSSVLLSKAVDAMKNLFSVQI